MNAHKSQDEKQSGACIAGAHLADGARHKDNHGRADEVDCQRDVSHIPRPHRCISHQPCQRNRVTFFTIDVAIDSLSGCVAILVSSSTQALRGKRGMKRTCATSADGDRAATEANEPHRVRLRPAKVCQPRARSTSLSLFLKGRRHIHLHRT
eukprot:3938197-Rhodomonas_salina.6